MRRRRLLSVTGLAWIGLAGCVGRGGVPGAEAGDRLVLDGVETPAAAVRLNDLGSAPSGEVPTVASLSERRRAAVRAALDGGYRTESTPEWLRSFLSRRGVVRVDGAYYRLDHDLPRYTVTAEAVSPEAVDGRIADREAYETAVRHDGVSESALLRMAREGGFTTVDPWPSLLEFLDRYDAVRRSERTYRLTLTVADGGPPYEVTAERVSPTDLAASVWNADGASERVREAVRTAGSADGVYASDDLPERLLDAVAAHEYVYLDGTFYWAGLENRGDLPVSLSATVVEPALSEGARLRLALSNDGDRRVAVQTGAPPPLGVLAAAPADAGSGAGRSLLWTEAYRESDHVFTEGRRVTGGEDVGISTPVPAGERLTETYELVGGPPPGEYVVRGDVGVEVVDDDSGTDGTLPYRVHLRVE